MTCMESTTLGCTVRTAYLAFILAEARSAIQPRAARPIHRMDDTTPIVKKNETAKKSVQNATTCWSAVSVGITTQK